MKLQSPTLHRKIDPSNPTKKNEWKLGTYFKTGPLLSSAQLLPKYTYKRHKLKNFNYFSFCAP